MSAHPSDLRSVDRTLTTKLLDMLNQEDSPKERAILTMMLQVANLMIDNVNIIRSSTATLEKNNLETKAQLSETLAALRQYNASLEIINELKTDTDSIKSLKQIAIGVSMMVALVSGLLVYIAMDKIHALEYMQRQQISMESSLQDVKRELSIIDTRVKEHIDIMAKSSK